MSDGVRYTCSFRHWGDIMARALGIEGDFAYVEWAFGWKNEEEPVFPKPEDWGETETVEHMKGYEDMEKQFLAVELGSMERAENLLSGEGVIIDESM